MQFKNPEIFYFLILLIIPFIVHLFQLQKFIKLPFSNVAFLQKLKLQTRKSSRVKKWLILCVRLMLFLAILFSFSQPYFSHKKSNERQHNFIYLDNSLSVNTEGGKGNLLHVAAQEIIENTSSKDLYTLQTNSEFYENITYLELKKALLDTKETSNKIDLSTILLKSRSKHKGKTISLDDVVLISDFQGVYVDEFTNVKRNISLVKLQQSGKDNISIDSVYVDNLNAVDFTLNVLIKNQGKAKNNIPIAIYDGVKLISKLSSSLGKDVQKIVKFKIPIQRIIKGNVKVTYSDTFYFDNTFYFTLENASKINVLCVGNSVSFLPRIYNNKEFNFIHSTLKNVNYNSLSKQQLIVLNEVDDIPDVFIRKLIEFSKNGGNLVVIPSEKIALNSYNSLFKQLNIGEVLSKKTDSLKITNINYSHPLLEHVFSKKVTNFQYPVVKTYYPVSSKRESKIILFENNVSFISQIKNAQGTIYWVGSSLSNSNSNFKNSPLIVPVFYNFAKLSFKQKQLFYRTNLENKIDIETNTGKENVLKIANTEESFIPLQQKLQSKVRITTIERPLKSGIYNVLKERDTIQSLAYNYPKKESLLSFLDLRKLKKTNKNVRIATTISSLFQSINKKNEVHWLWKWFLALAIVSLLLEILILKFYKP